MYMCVCMDHCPQKTPLSSPHTDRTWFWRRSSTTTKKKRKAETQIYLVIPYCPEQGCRSPIMELRHCLIVTAILHVLGWIQPRPVLVHTFCFGPLQHNGVYRFSSQSQQGAFLKDAQVRKLPPTLAFLGIKHSNFQATIHTPNLDNDANLGPEHCSLVGIQSNTWNCESTKKIKGLPKFRPLDWEPSTHERQAYRRKIKQLDSIGFLWGLMPWKRSKTCSGRRCSTDLLSTRKSMGTGWSHKHGEKTNSWGGGWCVSEHTTTKAS